MIAEAAVIVASILLAFAIDAWWDVRRDLEAEQLLLAALERDMARNQREADRVLEALGRAIASAEAFLQLSPDEVRHLPADSVQRLRARLVIATFDASAVYAGGRDLSVLRDERLLDQLGEWARELENVETTGAIVQEYVYAAIARQGEVAPNLTISPGPEDSQELSVLRADARFVGLLITNQQTRRTHAAFVRSLLAMTDSVSALIRNDRN
jgi:hypothetical protein